MCVCVCVSSYSPPQQHKRWRNSIASWLHWHLREHHLPLRNCSALQPTRVPVATLRRYRRVFGRRLCVWHRVWHHVWRRGAATLTATLTATTITASSRGASPALPPLAALFSTSHTHRRRDVRGFGPCRRWLGVHVRTYRSLSRTLSACVCSACVCSASML